MVALGQGPGGVRHLLRLEIRQLPLHLERIGVNQWPFGKDLWRYLE